MKLAISMVDNNAPARAGHSIYFYKETHYIFFGYDLKLDSPTNSIFRLKNGKWKKVETNGDQPSQRYGHSMSEKSKGILIFYGGYVQENLRTNEMFEFDCELLRWKKMKTKNNLHKNGIYEHSSVIKNDKM
jgi:hypothetical protein